MQTLQRMFSIINLLEEHGELRLQDFTHHLSMDKSTVYRFLSYLSDQKYVRRDDGTSFYRLGIRFVTIASHILKNIDTRSIAHPYLIELEKITREVIHLVYFDRNCAVYIDKVESDQPIQMSSYIGKTATLYSTAAGKVLLAFKELPERNRILKRLMLARRTENTITETSVLEKQLEKITIDGYAIDDGENEKGICCIAGPIRNQEEEVNAAISISAVSSRMPLDELLLYKDQLLEKCRSVSGELGYVEPLSLDRK
jgi:DNA-binding IclR family transcriptional regulator